MQNGITFDQQLISAADMAHFMYIFGNKQSGITKGCTMTNTSSAISVATGYFLACGRQVKVISTETINAPEVTTGTKYCRLVYEIDLSKINTENQFNQGYFTVITGDTDYPELTQQVLDDYPTTGIYQMPFAKFTCTIDGIDNFVDDRMILGRTGGVNWFERTLTAGQTTITIVDSIVTSDSMIDIYADVYNALPSSVVAVAGSVTITYPERASDLHVKVRIANDLV